MLRHVLEKSGMIRYLLFSQASWNLDISSRTDTYSLYVGVTHFVNFALEPVNIIYYK